MSSTRSTEPLRLEVWISNTSLPKPKPPPDTSWIELVCACCNREQHVPWWRRKFGR